MRQRCSNVNEQQLWHGTSYNVVEQICHQNFDWRLCSGNTAYGQGCYFAKDASYSQGYVVADSANIFYMFLADVLVGEYAQVVSVNTK